MWREYEKIHQKNKKPKNQTNPPKQADISKDFQRNANEDDSEAVFHSSENVKHQKVL